MHRTRNCNRCLVLSTFLAKTDLEKSDFLFSLLYSEISLAVSRIKLQNPVIKDSCKFCLKNRNQTRKKANRRRRGERAPSDRRIHYPGLLVILEREAAALDALEEYKTRGSWVPGTLLFLPLLLFFFTSFLPFPHRVPLGLLTPVP